MEEAIQEVNLDLIDLDQPLQPWKLVIHHYPDTDAWACLWAADRFVVPKSAERRFVFASSGDQLPLEETDGYSVLYMDTGGGDCDQHGKGLVRGSSFQLLAEKYAFANDPGIFHILELTRATDNVELIARTSMHYYFKGLPFIFTDTKTKEVDWEGVLGRVFEVLDLFYSQGKNQARAAWRFKKADYIVRLGNGLKIALLWEKPNLREAAFDARADVVMWTEKKEDNLFYVGIQVSRAASLHLGDAMFGIRMAEAKIRGQQITSSQARQVGTIEAIPGWFMHDSGKLILCGSRSHDLSVGEHTKLEPYDILQALKVGLERWIRPT